MVKKTRLGLYLENEDVKKQIKIAAARRGLSTTAYCVQAIEERLRKDGGLNREAGKKTMLTHMDRFRKEVGALGTTAAELVKEGRRR
jgi:hypothetical protein